MTEQEIFQNAAILELQQQRNAALDRLANAAGENAVLRHALEEAQRQLQELKPKG
jgi:hypothetical protein